MSRSSPPAHAVTANRLDSGEVVFRRGSGWVAQLADAETYGDPGAADAVVLDAKAQPTEVVDPYRIELVDDAGRLLPQSYRERIRALGPTVRRDLGKQVSGGARIEALREASMAGRSTGRLGLIARKR